MEKVPDGDEGGTYKRGSVVAVGQVEYAYNGESWQELGDESRFSDKVEGWDHAAAVAHEHTNLGLLETISNERVTKWDSAEDKAVERSAQQMDERLAELKISNLVENQEEDYVVLDCGNALDMEPDPDQGPVEP